MTAKAKSTLSEWGKFLIPILVYLVLFAYGYGNLNATVENNKASSDKDREQLIRSLNTLTTDFKDFMKEYRENEKRREENINEFYKTYNLDKK